MPFVRSIERHKMSQTIKTNRSRSARTLRVTSAIIQQTVHKKKMSTNQSSLDSTLFVQAGTSGIRHLYPIHLSNSNDHNELFVRSISRLRSRTSANEQSSNMNMIRNVCLTLEHLQHFDISQNDLTEIPDEIYSLDHLESINCSHNQLTDLSEQFDELKFLKDFDLSFNQFRSIPKVIYLLKHLIRLNFEHNFLKQIDTNLSNLKYLKTLVLDHNRIQSLDSIDFSRLKRLEYLHITHNQLTRFPFNLYKLTHLKNLNLSHNHLTSFPVELFLINTLDVVNLSHNFITKLSPLTDSYKRTTMIFSIDLSFNQLTKFYDYLLLICLKLDLSNNKIQILPFDLLRKLDYSMTIDRDLNIANNPLIQPIIPHEILTNQMLRPVNMLQLIRTCLSEQQSDIELRQGLKISIIGCKKSGKSSLAYCLEEYMPLIPEQKEDRLVNILQFQFQFEIKPKKTIEHARVRFAQSDAVKKPSSAPARQNLSILSSSSSHSTVSFEPIRTLPVAIYDFTGSSNYYEYMMTFLDTNSLHLICIHTADFHQAMPNNIDEVFNNEFDRSKSPMIEPLFQLLELICDKATETNGLMIIPVATCIDLYDKRSTQEKSQVLDKINQFFRLYLQYRLDRIQSEIDQIHTLETISSSMSDRLKSSHTLLNISIQIESCQPISSLSYQGIDELNHTIQQCLRTQNTIFPHVDRVFPTLWADANQLIESLADQLAVPYLLWENFTSIILNKYGLRNLINDIALSLHDQGKILILKEIGTDKRLVILRPLWLGDLLSSLFRSDLDYELNGCFTPDYIRSLWNCLIHRKEYFSQILFYLMRFCLIGYPKMNRKQLKTIFLLKDDQLDMKFESIILPNYLPWASIEEIQDETNSFIKQLTNRIQVRYECTNLPLGFFHRYSTSIVFKFDFIYIKHYNNFLLSEHETISIRFLFETDHRSYVNILCGTNIIPQPFDQIWKVLMLILNHFEELFKIIAPNHQFQRLVQCPCCLKCSFMGEWMTPKELQGLKTKQCSSCSKEIDTNYLVQPNESKRKNEELLKKIRERKSLETSNLLI